MRTINVNLYQFDELSDKAKENAREWYRRASEGDSFWSECVIDDAVNLGAKLGITIDRKRVYWSQGDGASFTGAYAYVKGASKDIRAECPQDTELHRIADALQRIQRRHFYKLTASVSQSGYYSHSGTMRVECDDDAIGDELRAFADWIYRRLESEWEYQNSNECVDENIRANEYEFDENGWRA